MLFLDEPGMLTCLHVNEEALSEETEHEIHTQLGWGIQQR